MWPFQRWQQQVPVEDAGAVHVLQGLQQLPHVLAHQRLAQVHAAAADQLVDVPVHQLKHQRQAPSPVVAAGRPAGPRSQEQTS